MAMADIGVGSTITWGISPTLRDQVKSSMQSNGGVVLSWNADKEAIAAPCENEIGQRIGERVYDYHKTSDMTFQIPAGTKPPAMLTKVSIEGVQWIIRNIRETENNRDYKKFSARLEAWATGFQLKEAQGIVTTNLSQSPNDFPA